MIVCPVSPSAARGERSHERLAAYRSRRLDVRREHGDYFQLDRGGEVSRPQPPTRAPPVVEPRLDRAVRPTAADVARRAVRRLAGIASWPWVREAELPAMTHPELRRCRRHSEFRVSRDGVRVE